MKLCAKHFLNAFVPCLYDPRGYEDGWWYRLPLGGWSALLVVLIAGVILYLAVRRREKSRDSSMLDLLNKQYLEGLITKEEFERQKRKITREE